MQSLPNHRIEAAWADQYIADSIEELSVWSLVRSRPNLEFRLFDRLIGAGHSVCFPVCQTSHRTPSGQRRVTVRPLFPGYLFLLGGRDGRIAALETRLVLRVETITDQDRFQQELGNLLIALASGQPLWTGPVIRPGGSVVVIEGPFSGFRGAVVEVFERTRIVACNLNCLGRSVRVEVPADWVEPEGS